jgi:hypothetical protein
MAARKVRERVIQMPGGLGESCLQARAAFLDSVLDLRPHVVSDLWARALDEFKLVILRRFRREISEGLDCSLEDHLKSALEKIRRAPQIYPDVLVDLVQQNLTPSWTAPVTPENLVQEVFRSWATLRGKENKTLRKKVREWSRRWNLDANWCRDHALTVLREWLLDESLKWLHFFPHFEEPLKAKGWRSAVRDIEGNVLVSQLTVDGLVHGHGSDSEPFSFSWPDWPGLSYEISWNLANESEVEFKKRAHLNFRVSLDLTELRHLKPLAETETRRNALTMGELHKELAWRNGALEQFEIELRSYVKSMISRKVAAKTKRTVVEAPRFLGIDDVRWLLMYQVPSVDKACLSYQKIASQYDLTSIQIRKSVENVSLLIGLALRNRYMHSGRPIGPGKPITHRVNR